jgi:hypothetical protein
MDNVVSMANLVEGVPPHRGFQVHVILRQLDECSDFFIITAWIIACDHSSSPVEDMKAWVYLTESRNTEALVFRRLFLETMI